jgi:hypothetical protein
MPPIDSSISRMDPSALPTAGSADTFGT